MLRYWLVSGGMISRSACGTTTSFIACAARQAERRGRLGLAVRHREHAGAHDLGDEAGGVGDEPEGQRREFGIELQAARQVEAGRAREAEIDRPPGGEIGERGRDQDQRERDRADGRALAGQRLPAARLARQSRARATTPARERGADRPGALAEDRPAADKGRDC